MHFQNKTKEEKFFLEVVCKINSGKVSETENMSSSTVTEKHKESMNEQLEKLHSELQGMKSKLTALNIRSAMLNIDLVSLHDPKIDQRLKEEREICNQCFQNCEERSKQQPTKSDIKNNIEKVQLVVKESEE